MNKKLNQYGFDVKLKQINNNNFYKFNNLHNVYSIQQLFLYGLKSF